VFYARDSSISDLIIQEKEISADWVIFQRMEANPDGQPLLEKVPPAPT
jgi:hypothetical protein